MSKFHDDSTWADDAIDIGLSLEKLEALDPREFEKERVSHDLLHEHLGLGDTCAAVVACSSPLLVAAYSHDLDCIAMLRFPEFLVDEYRLSVGSRLLTINTYKDGPDYDSDLLPGDDQTGRWTGFFPIIAEFVSDGLPQIEARKLEIEEEEWFYVRVLADDYLDAHGTDHARNGHPYESELPVGEPNPSLVVLFGILILAAILGGLVGVLAANRWAGSKTWAIAGGAVTGLTVGTYAGLLLIGWIFIGRKPAGDGQPPR